MFRRGKKQPHFTSDYLKLRKRFFLVELRPLFLESFQGSGTQFQSKRLVMLWKDVYVTADLYQAKRPTSMLQLIFVKPSARISPK